MASAIATPNRIHNSCNVQVNTGKLRLARILVGIDFTESSLWALRTAIQFAERYQSELFLVHAVTPVTSARERELNTSKALRAELDRAREEMNWLTARDQRLRMLYHTTTVAFSDAQDLIDQVARVEDVDLIIVGSHRLSPVERATLGSVTEAVLRRSACPVLVVGPGCHHDANPLRSIVFATDLKTTGLRAAQYATSLASGSDGAVTVLNVVENRVVASRKMTRHSVEEELERTLPGPMGRANATKIRVEYGTPADVILAVLELEAATLLVVGLRDNLPSNRAAGWSTLTTLVGEARCPILGVRGRMGC
jgi:nucleotide-binding universal stress UspA family protein